MAPQPKYSTVPVFLQVPDAWFHWHGHLGNGTRPRLVNSWTNKAVSVKPLEAILHCHLLSPSILNTLISRRRFHMIFYHSLWLTVVPLRKGISLSVTQKIRLHPVVRTITHEMKAEKPIRTKVVTKCKSNLLSVTVHVTEIIYAAWSRQTASFLL